MHCTWSISSFKCSGLFRTCNSGKKAALKATRPTWGFPLVTSDRDTTDNVNINDKPGSINNEPGTGNALSVIHVWLNR